MEEVIRIAVDAHNASIHAATTSDYGGCTPSELGGGAGFRSKNSTRPDGHRNSQGTPPGPPSRKNPAPGHFWAPGIHAPRCRRTTRTTRATRERPERPERPKFKKRRPERERTHQNSSGRAKGGSWAALRWDFVFLMIVLLDQNDQSRVSPDQSAHFA